MVDVVLREEYNWVCMDRCRGKEEEILESNCSMLILNHLKKNTRALEDIENRNQAIK